MAEKPLMEGLESINSSEHIGPRQTGDNINAKRVAQYVWDGSSWQRMVQPGETVVSVKKTLIDKTTTTDVVYIGQADSGTATSASSWTITKVDKSSGVAITHTGETAVWDDRVSESYS